MWDSVCHLKVPSRKKKILRGKSLSVFPSCMYCSLPLTHFVSNPTFLFQPEFSIESFNLTLGSIIKIRCKPFKEPLKKRKGRESKERQVDST